MKRFIVLFMLVALFCPILALAAEGAPPSLSPQETPPLWEEWGYDSLEEFLEIMGMTEGEYYEFEARQKRLDEELIRWEEEHRQRRIREFEEFGGTYGVVNVMFNGGFISFAGGVPEIIDGSVFAPAVSIFEAMGAKVDYERETGGVTAEFADRSICLTIDQEMVVFEENGDEREFSIGLAPYAKNGVSYMPVRAVSEALGYEVLWDSEFKTVVMLDIEGIIAEIDKDFTILNKLFESPIKMRPDDGGAYRTMVEMLVSVTQFDSLNGDKNADFAANINIHSDGSNYHIKGAVDLSELLDFMLAADSYAYYSDEDIKEMNDVFNMISSDEMELIYSFDKDVLYAKMPFIHLLVPEIPENAWISVSGVYEQLFEAGLGSFVEELGFDFMSDGMSVGRIIYLGSLSYGYRFPVYFYGEMMDDAEGLKSWAGDNKFTRSGTDYTLTLTQEDLENNSNSPGMSYYRYYNDFGLKFVIRTHNDIVTGIAGSFLYHERYYYSETQYSASFDISAGSIQFSFDAHEKNVMKMRIDIGAETKAASEPVPQAPPEGANIIPIEELFPDQFDRLAIMPLLFANA